MTLHAFPPRDAGRVLEAALAAAIEAAKAEARRWPCSPRGAPHPEAALHLEQAALNAAAPILRALTADARMVAIVAAGMAIEAAERQRKAGAI